MENTRTGLSLTEEEAYALLLMCMMSPAKIEGITETALRKLANYCKHGKTKKRKRAEDVTA